MAEALPEFRFVAGSPALDFLNTVDWDGDAPTESERFRDYPDLLDWAQSAGVIERGLAGKLGALARRDSAGAARALGSALRTRASIRTAMRETAEHGKPSRAALENFNRMLRGALSHAELAPPGGSARWSWQGAEQDLASPLWPVLWSAAELLASPEARLIRECEGDDCGWMFVDRSRPGNRRWCEMETCGNRAKARRHYERTKITPTP